MKSMFSIFVSGEDVYDRKVCFVRNMKYIDGHLPNFHRKFCKKNKWGKLKQQHFFFNCWMRKIDCSFRTAGIGVFRNCKINVSRCSLDIFQCALQLCTVGPFISDTWC